MKANDTIEQQLQKALAALRFLDRHNPIRNDWDAYCGAVAQWGLGITLEPPDPVDYGVQTYLTYSLEVV